MQEWISKCTCPDWMCVGCKHHPFWNERHTIACGFSTIMWFAETVKRRDIPRERGIPEFYEIGKTLGTMMWCTRPIWNCAKAVIMDSGFCVTKGLGDLRKKGLFGAAIIKKCRYWPSNIKGDTIVPTLLRRKWAILMQ